MIVIDWGNTGFWELERSISAPCGMYLKVVKPEEDEYDFSKN